MAKYCILKDGTIYNFETKKKLKSITHPSGYLVVNLISSKKRKQERVHILVGKGYIPNPEKRPHINHMDGNKANNHVSNLEWCTLQENNTHARKMNLSPLSKVFWSNHRQAWIGRIVFETKVHTKFSKDNKQLVEEWLEAKRREFYGD